MTKLYTTRTAAKLLGVSHFTIARWVKRVDHYQAGRYILLDAKQIEELKMFKKYQRIKH